MLKSKKIMAAVLALVVAMFCLTACGPSGGSEERDPKLVGEWITTQTEAVEGFEITVEGHLYLNEDGTMKLQSTIDHDSLYDVGSKLYEQTLGGVSAEAEAEFLKEYGAASKEEWIEGFCAEIEGSLAEGTLSGYWRTRDGALLSYETKEDYDGDICEGDHIEPYVLSDNDRTMDLDNADGNGAVFTKV